MSKSDRTALASESEVIAFNNTNPLEADFESKCERVVFHSTEDVHVAFDSVANTGSFLVKADVMTSPIDVEFTRISALGNSTTGDLYILAIR